LVSLVGVAFAAGTPARLVVFTALSGSGQPRLQTTYEVIGGGRVRVTVDPTTSLGNEIVVSECTGLTDSGVTPQVTGCTEVSRTPVTATPTATSVTVTPTNPVPAGQPVTVAVKVTTADGQPVPSGRVLIYDYQRTWAGAPVDAGGHADLVVTPNQTSSYFSVLYTGDSQYRSSLYPEVRIETT
jgi:hypothetical protein